MAETEELTPLDQRLANISRAVENATPGGWNDWSFWDIAGDECVFMGGPVDEAGYRTTEVMSWAEEDNGKRPSASDAWFISAARADLPALLAAVKAVLALCDSPASVGGMTSEAVRGVIAEHLVAADD